MSVALALLSFAVTARADAPDRYTVKSIEGQDDIEVATIEYSAPGAQGPTQALLVRPTDGGKGEGILYLHLYGRGNAYREFLDEARRMAAEGIVCLLPEGRVPLKTRWTGKSEDLEMGEGQLAEYRAALGILRGERGVKRDRVFIVGHDYGAMYGLVLMAEDPDVPAGAFLAFAPSWSSWIRYFRRPDSLPKDEYDRLMEGMDPLKALSLASGRPLFLQFAKDDYYVGAEDFERILKTAGPSPVVDVVSAPGLTHENLDELGAPARLAWLEKLLQSP